MDTIWLVRIWVLVVNVNNKTRLDDMLVTSVLRQCSSALAMVLPSNSTLRRLELGQPQKSNNDLALGKNTVLKSLKVDARRNARGSILDASQYFSSRAITLWPEIPSMVEYLVKYLAAEVSSAVNSSCVKGREDPASKQSPY
jgi:hypothetical protein